MRFKITVSDSAGLTDDPLTADSDDGTMWRLEDIALTAYGLPVGGAVEIERTA